MRGIVIKSQMWPTMGQVYHLCQRVPDIKCFASIVLNSMPEIENVTVSEDLVTNKMGKTIIALHAVQDQVSRPHIAPPGTPADIMKILRDAFAKVAEDPELKKDAETLMMTIKYVPADECLKLYHDVLNQPEDIVKEFSKHIKF